VNNLVLRIVSARAGAVAVIAAISAAGCSPRFGARQPWRIVEWTNWSKRRLDIG